MDQESENIEAAKTENQNSESQSKEENIESLRSESENRETDKAKEIRTSKIHDAYSKTEDFQDKYIRVLADLENLKRRQLKEREDAVQRTRSQFISDLLPILDAFQMGMHEVEKDESTKNIFIGISMAYKQMENTLGEYGLELISPEGSEFDPRFHEALSYQESDDIVEGHVLKTIRIGYKLRDKLLRPASVIISQGKEAK